MAQAVAALDDDHVGDRVNIFLARLCFREIYFPMMRKSSWLRVILENRRTILRLFKEEFPNGCARAIPPAKIRLTLKRPMSAVTPTLKQIS